MKIFNVNIRVAVTQVAEIPDMPDPAADAPKPFNDDPLDKQEKLMDKYFDKIAGLAGTAAPSLRPYGEAADGVSMIENVTITAEDFQDLSAILKRFADVAKTLPAVPKSLLAPGVQP